MTQDNFLINEWQTKISQKQSFQIVCIYGMIKYDEILEFLKKIYQDITVDYIKLSAEEKKQSIGIDQIKEFKKQLLLSSFSGKKISLIYQANLLTKEASNSLLKILEELPKNSQLFITAEKNNLPITIQSRINLSINLPKLIAKSDLVEDFVNQENIVGKLKWIEKHEKEIEVKIFLHQLIEYYSKKKDNYHLKNVLLELIKLADTNVNQKLILEYLTMQFLAK